MADEFIIQEWEMDGDNTDFLAFSEIDFSKLQNAIDYHENNSIPVGRERTILYKQDNIDGFKAYLHSVGFVDPTAESKQQIIDIFDVRSSSSEEFSSFSLSSSTSSSLELSNFSSSSSSSTLEFSSFSSSSSNSSISNTSSSTSLSSSSSLSSSTEASLTSTSISSSSSSEINNKLNISGVTVTDIQTTSNTYVDITGASIDITLNSSSHIGAFLIIQSFYESAPDDISFRILINGIASQEFVNSHNNINTFRLSNLSFRTENKLSSGTYNIKAQYKTTNSNQLTVTAKLLAIGFEDNIGNEILSDYSSVQNVSTASAINTDIVGLNNNLVVDDLNKNIFSILSNSIQTSTDGNVNVLLNIQNESSILVRSFTEDIPGIGGVILSNKDKFINNSVDISSLWSTSASLATGNFTLLSFVLANGDRYLYNNFSYFENLLMSNLSTNFTIVPGSTTWITNINNSRIYPFVFFDVSSDVSIRDFSYRLVVDGVPTDSFTRTLDKVNSFASVFGMNTDGVLFPADTHQIYLEVKSSRLGASYTIQNFYLFAFNDYFVETDFVSSSSSIEFSNYSSSSSTSSSLEFSSFSQSSLSSSTFIESTSSSSSSTEDSGVTSSSSSSIEFSSFSSSSTFISSTSSNSSSSSTEQLDTSSSSTSSSSFASQSSSSSTFASISSSSSMTITSSSSSSSSSIEFSSFSSSSSSTETLQEVKWHNFINCNVIIGDANTIEKFSGAVAWDSGANSQQELISGSGFVEWELGNVSTRKFLGLSNQVDPQDADRDQAGWGITARTNDFFVREFGSNVYSNNNSLNPGDKLRIYVTPNGTVEYYLNDNLEYTSLNPIQYPVQIDTSMREVGTRIINANLHGNWQIRENSSSSSESSSSSQGLSSSSAGTVVTAIAQTTTGISTGNVDITTTDLSGLTPKAALIIVNGTTTDATRTDNNLYGIGFTDGTTTLSGSYREEHNVSTTDTGRRSQDDELIQILTSASNSVDGEASFVSFITNGIRVNWGVAPSNNYKLKVIFFAGSDVSAYVNKFATPSVINTATNVTGVGFEPDLVFTLHNNNDDFTSDSNGTLTCSLGVCSNDTSSVAQGSMLYISKSGRSSTNLVGERSNSRSITTESNGTVELDNFDSDGFDAFIRDTGGTALNVGFLALNFNGAANFSVDFFDSPTTTGSVTHTCGFKPQFAFIMSSMISSLDTLTTDNDAGLFGLSANTVDSQFSISQNSEDAASTVNSSCVSDDVSINMDDATGTSTFAATFTEFHSTDGITLNYTNTDGTARKWVMLTIE